MGLSTETQTTATCESDGCKGTRVMPFGRKKSIKHLRNYGWTIGKKVICSKCNGTEKFCDQCGTAIYKDQGLWCHSCWRDEKDKQGLCWICDGPLDEEVDGIRRCPKCCIDHQVQLHRLLRDYATTVQK